MKLVVIGSTGQVATALRAVCPRALYLDRAALDLADLSSIAATVSEYKPEFIVNAAAYTAVDEAEDEPELAFRINAEAVGVLASTARALNAGFIHLSTDYVYAGDKEGAYIESDSVGPLGSYGRSKLEGERYVQEAGPSRHWILRTSWVFSATGRNFVKTMLRLAAEDNHLHIVDDQRGIPTYAGDIAVAIQRVAALEARGEGIEAGTYHATSGGNACSWCEFAHSIFASARRLGKLSSTPQINAITSQQFPTRAQRPRNSELDSTKLRQALGKTFPPWRDGLDEAMNSL